MSNDLKERHPIRKEHKEAWEYFILECNSNLDLLIMRAALQNVPEETVDAVLVEIRYRLEARWFEKMLMIAFPSLYHEYLS